MGLGYKQFEKTKFRVNTDEYIDIAVKEYLQIKIDPASTLTVDDYLTLKILAVDGLENLLLGLGMIKFGKNEDGTESMYALKYAEGKQKLEIKPGVKIDLETKNRFAGYRFQLLIGAIKGKDPADISFEA